MKKKNAVNKAGFTLLELLIVVLIIGILAAIALPQYKKAVAKSKATQLQTLVSSVVKSAEGYYLVHNAYPTSFEDLDIDLTWSFTTNNVCNVSVTGNKAIKQNGDYQMILNMSASIAVILGIMTDGPYKCTGFAYFLKGDDVPLNHLICSEATYARGTKNQKGDFCEKVIGQTYYGQKYYWWQFK